MAHERICIVSPKHHYEYCAHCNGFQKTETWRYLFCGENCRGIFNTINEYLTKKYDIVEARRRLKTYDLTDKEFYADSTKRVINEILADEIENNEESSVEVLVQESLVEITELEIPAMDSVEEVVEIKPKRAKKKNIEVID